MKKFETVHNVVQTSRGYVILFTVLITSIILAIALGISNVAFREVTFNIQARDSHYALFAADSAAECALHHLFATPSPFYDVDGSWLPSVTIVCGDENGQPNSLVASTLDTVTPDYIFATNTLGNSSGVSLPKGCGIPRVIQTSVGSEKYLRVQGIGYNMACADIQNLTPRSVERAIEYTFLVTTDDGSGNQDDGSGLPPLSLFDPSSIQGTIMSAQNNGTVLGTSQGGTLWGSITDFLADIFGIQSQSNPDTPNYNSSQSGTEIYKTAPTPVENPLNLGAQQYGSGSQYQYVDGTIDEMQKMVAPSGTILQQEGTQQLSQSDNGLELQTAPNEEDALIWLNRFANDGTDNQKLISSARDPQIIDSVLRDTDYSIEVSKLSTISSDEEKSIAIADMLLSRYGEMTGEQELIASIDRKKLIDAAYKISFQGDGQNPETVKALFSEYSDITGNTDVLKIDPELFSKLVTEFQLVSNPVDSTVSKVEATPTIIQRLQTGLRIIGLGDEVAVNDTTDSTAENLEIAKRILINYGERTGDWQTVSMISPEILMQIITRYTRDGVVTEKIARETLATYQTTVGDQSIIRDVDTAAFATATNEARLESRIAPLSATAGTTISAQDVDIVLKTIVIPEGEDLSFVQSEPLAQLMNTVLPNEPITPDVAGAFLARYGEAIGDETLKDRTSPEEFAIFLNSVRAISEKQAALAAMEKPTLADKVRSFIVRIFGGRKARSEQLLQQANQTEQSVLNLLR